MTVETLHAAPAESVWDLLAQQVRPGPRCTLAAEEALGAVLAEDVRAAFDFPPFDRAMMDGYAVRAADFASQPTRLRNAGLVRAGSADPGRVEPGCCLRINTGAPVPQGADAVVIVEKTREAADGQVELDDEPTAGQNIGPRAGLLSRGDLLVRAGTRVGPGAVAALVAGGIDRVTIFKRPAVALLSTGDEVVRAGRELKPGQIYDSNSVVLRELIGAAGGEAIGLGRCPDEPDRLKQAVAQGLEHDVLCIVGGMSKGTHDLVPAVLEELGVHWVVSGLNLKPGKPTRIGRAENGCWVVGLPGNPVSCAVCFLLFTHGILEGLQGLPVRRPPHLRGRTDADLPPNGARPMYQPAEWLVGADGGVQVSPLLWRGSGDPFGLSLANALIHRPANAPAAPRGQTVDFVPFDRPR